MLGAIVRFSISYAGLVCVMAAALTVFGSLELSRAGLDIFPEFSPKAVVIQTEAPGLTTEQIEMLVSRPIETSLIGLIGLEYVASESIQGLSIVTAVFADDTDIFQNRQFVSERLAAIARQFPVETIEPVVVPLASSSATVRTIGLQSDRFTPIELRHYADTVLIPKIFSVDGVADVNVFGGLQRALQIQIKPRALAEFRVSVPQIIEALQGVAGAVPFGFIANENQRISLSLSRGSVSAATIASIIVDNGADKPPAVGDLATIVVGGEPAFSAAQIDGRSAVVMMVIGQLGTNALTVSKALERELEALGARLRTQGIELHDDLFVPANYIEASLKNISEHIALGAFFVLVVLIAFLFDWRAAFISAVAIPLSLIGAAIGLLFAGLNFNVMVLGGLAIALGEVVDDAIIDTENIYRRLRENVRSADVQPLAQIVYRASMEVRGSVVYATFIVALVFVPLLTLSGVAGRLFAPLGITYIVAILASLAVALTVTPALSALLLGGKQLGRDDPPIVRAIKPFYRRVLGSLIHLRWTLVGAVVLICVGVAMLLPSFGTQFLPPLREGHYIVHTTGLPGTSLAESIRLGTLLTNELATIDGVVSTSQWAGRAERGADTYGTHYSEYEIALADMSGRDQQRALDAIRDTLAKFPGLLFEANTFLTERVDETISGYASPVVINIFGRDLDRLDRKAVEIMALAQELEGSSEVRMRAISTTPQAEIAFDNVALKELGVDPVALISTLQTSYGGYVVGYTFEGDIPIPVVLTLDAEQRRSLLSIRELPVRTRDGTMLRLGDVASVQQVSGRYNVLRRDGRRLQAVTMRVEGPDVGGFAARLRAAIEENIELPAEMNIEMSGSAFEQASSRRDLIVHSLLAMLGVLMLIFVAVGKFWHVLLIMVNLPFALVGGVMAVLLTGSALSIGSVVGFVTLFGITVRNSIMLVSHYQHLVHDEGCDWNAETAIRGAEERLPSIIMTALVTALAMLPIAIGSDNPGREIMGPMAAIIIGGLGSSAILNLLIMPTLMYQFGRFGTDG